jgi:hypothetical protein
VIPAAFADAPVAARAMHLPHLRPLNRRGTDHLMAPIRILVILFIAAALTAPAGAADVVFPTGSRMGLAPPPAMTVSKNFFGFEDRDNKVAIVIVPLPAEAYGEIEQSISSESLARQGLTLEGREDVTLGFGKGLLVRSRQELDHTQVHKWILVAGLPEMTAVVTAQVPDDARKTYSDETIRAALMSLSVRPTVPNNEQLSLLPFKVTELAGFRIGGLLAGRAVILTDGPPGKDPTHLITHIVVAIAPGGPTLPTDREPFARDLFTTIPNIGDVRLISAEPLRIGNQQGYQIMARAKDPTGADITVVQWLRFGSGLYMQMIGVSPSDSWLKAYARFRQVRDGID